MNRKFLIASLMLAGFVVSNGWAQAQSQQTTQPKQTGAQPQPSAKEQPAKQPERITAADLKKKLDSGEKMLLIDVREDWELKADGAIPGAIHIPVGELDARMKDIPKDVQLVFY
jgi:3-mercaptopyruvate sulfurtransferase SseA